MRSKADETFVIFYSSFSFFSNVLLNYSDRPNSMPKWTFIPCNTAKKAAKSVVPVLKQTFQLGVGAMVNA